MSDFVDEVNIDYSKLLKTTAAEGLRVEDLVKQYFEAAEQVLCELTEHLFFTWCHNAICCLYCVLC